jgi:hypothetical protein
MYTADFNDINMKRFILSILFFVGAVRLGFGQVAGDFQTRQTGNWNDSNTWEEWTGSSWDNTANTPTSADGVITLGHDVILQSPNILTVDQIEYVNDFSGITGTLTINSGATLNVANGPGDDIRIINDFLNIGFLRVNGNLNLNQGATIVEDDYGNIGFGAQPTTSTVLGFGSGSVCTILSSGSIPSIINSDIRFYDLIWNGAGQTSIIDLAGRLQNVNNNFSINGTNGQVLRLTNSTNLNLTIGNDFLIDGNSRVIISGSATTTVNVGGNLFLSSTSTAPNTITSTFTNITTINVAGDFYKTNASTFSFGAGPTSSTTLNLDGSMFFTGGVLTGSTAATTNFQINFNNVGEINFTNLPNSVVYFNYNIGNSSDYNLIAGGLTGRGTFILNSSGKLNVSSVSGIVLGTTSGPIRVEGTRTFSPGATIEYNGTSTQSLGNGFPTAGVDLIVNNTGGGVNMNSDITISSGRTLTLTEGTLNIGNGNLLTLNGNVVTTNGGISGGPLSDLTIGGTGAFGTLGFVGTQELRNFTINRTSSGSVTLGGDLTVLGDFTQTEGDLLLNGNQLTINSNYTQAGGTLISNSTSSLIVNGAGTLPPSLSFSGDINSITLDRASATLNTGASGFAVTNLNLFSGTLDGSAIGIANSGIVERRSGGSLANALIPVGTYDLLYNNNGVMTSGVELHPTAINNLTKTGTSTLTVASNFDVNGILTLSNGAFDAGANIISLNGDFVSNAASTLTSATVSFDGVTNLSGSTAPTFGNIAVNNTFNPTSNLNVNGDITNNGTLNSSGGTLTINAASQLGGSNPINVNNFTIGAGGSVTASASQALEIDGNFTNNGSFAANDGTVIFGGTTSISGTVPDFASVQVDGILNAPPTLNLTGGLTVNNGGAFNNNAGIVNMTGTGSRSIGGDGAFNLYTLNVDGGTVSNNNSGGINIEDGITIGASTTLDLDGGGSGLMTLLSTPSKDAYIAEVPTGSTISGSINVQRAIYTVGGDGRGYHIVGFPVSGLTVSEIQDDLSVTGPFAGASVCPTSNCVYSIYSFDEVAAGNGVFDNGYAGFPSSGNGEAFTHGEGYYIFNYNGEPASGIIEGNGSIYSGNFDVTLSRTGSSDGSGWHMVSNPYPAPTDWTQWNGNGIVEGNIAYLYNPDGGNYMTLDGNFVGPELIAQGQGFFVRALSNNVTLSATEASKVTGTTPTYYRTLPQERFEIILKTPHYEDKTIVSFNHEATDNYEPQYDAVRLLNTYETLSTLTEDNEMVKVNRLAPVTNSTNCGRSIRLNLEQMVVGNDYALIFNGITTLTLQYMILVDHFLDTQTKVTDELVYNFSVTDDAASKGSDRFELVLSTNSPQNVSITSSTACPDEPAILTIENTQSYVNYVFYNSTNEVIATAVGNGGAMDIEVSQDELSSGINDFTIEAFVNGCDTVAVGNAQIEVISTLTLDNEVNGTSICRLETKAPFSISTQLGVNYYILNGQDTIQTVVGTGGLYEGFIAADNFSDGLNELAIGARKGSCESGTLNKTLQFEVYQNAVIDAVENRSVCLNETVTIDLSANVDMKSYLVFVGDELVLEDSTSTLILSPQETVTYTLKGVPENGCEVNTVNFTIEVNDLAKPGILISGNVLESSIEGDSYQWYLDDEILSGETSKILVANEMGDYKVEVSKVNCKTLSDSFTFNEEVLSAIRALQSALKLYPNPVHDRIFIELSDIDSVNVTIFTLSGRFIDSFELNSRQSEIDMNKFPKGTYLVQFESEEASVTKRIIKQ